MNDDARALMRDVRRGVVDALGEIGDAVQRLEAGETIAAEALLGEAVTRLKLLDQRLEEATPEG